MKQIQYNNLHIAIMVILQMVIANFIYLGPYICITLMPLVVMMMPLHWKSETLLLAACIVSIPVDVLAEGVSGLNMAALLPVAFLKPVMMNLITTKISMEREAQISLKWLGANRFAFLSAASLLVFLFLYNILDCAGTRPISFILVKTGISFTANIVLYFLIALSLDKTEKR